MDEKIVKELFARLDRLDAKVELQRKRLDVFIHGKDLDDSYNPATTVIGPGNVYPSWQRPIDTGDDGE